MRRRIHFSVDANIYFYCYFNFEWTRLFRLLTFTLSSLLFQLINLYARMKHLSLWSPACVWMGPLEWAYWAIRSVSVYNLQLKFFSLWKTHQHEAIKAIASCHIPFVQDGKTFLETYLNFLRKCVLFGALYTLPGTYARIVIIKMFWTADTPKTAHSVIISSPSSPFWTQKKTFWRLCLEQHEVE